jgi:hypothetical protein
MCTIHDCWRLKKSKQLAQAALAKDGLQKKKPEVSQAQQKLQDKLITKIGGQSEKIVAEMIKK